MPKIIKRKAVKKRHVEETEEVKTAALHAFDAMKAKQRQVIMIASIVAAIALVFFIFKYNTSSNEAKVHGLEMEANSIYYPAKAEPAMPEMERWKKALELYKKAVDLKATPTALFSLGNCYYNLADYENAIKQYNVFAGKFSDNYVILPLVYQKLASAYFKTGKNDKALETLASLSKIRNGMFKDTALLMEARYYEISGSAGKAQEKYKELVSGFPNSPWSAEATAKVSQSTRKEAAPVVEQKPPVEEPAKK